MLCARIWHRATVRGRAGEDTRGVLGRWAGPRRRGQPWRTDRHNPSACGRPDQRAPPTQPERLRPPSAGRRTPDARVWRVLRGSEAVPTPKRPTLPRAECGTSESASNAPGGEAAWMGRGCALRVRAQQAAVDLGSSWAGSVAGQNSRGREQDGSREPEVAFVAARGVPAAQVVLGPYVRLATRAASPKRLRRTRTPSRADRLGATRDRAIARV